MWRNQTIGVVLPTYNEKDSIAATIQGFEAMSEVDKILVVNNNAAPGTSEEVARTSAIEVCEATQGYGAAIKRGLADIGTDFVVVCEPDGTFDPSDLQKLLAFLPECDVVVGSRTVSNFIWQGANMGPFLQWGNWAVAKMLEIAYNTGYLSDVGCTFRVLTADEAKAILNHSKLDGSAFGLEMLLISISRRSRVVQIPVNYHPRVGESSVTGDFSKTVKLGLEMIRLIIRMRIGLRSFRRNNSR